MTPTFLFNEVMMAFGSTFGAELAAAGLHGLPCSVTEDGNIIGREQLTEQQLATLEAVIAAHNPQSGVKDELKARVDDDAERVRLRYITPGVGMSMTYLEKHNQAVSVEEMGEAAANALTDTERNAQFPTLSASVGVEAESLWGCAQLVIQRYEAWAALSNSIERTRLLGKKAISDASDAAAARAAYEAITWPT